MNDQKFLAAWMIIFLSYGFILCLMPHPPQLLVKGKTYHYTFNLSSNMSVALDPCITKIGEEYHRDIIAFNNITNYNATKWGVAGNATVSSDLTKLTTEYSTLGHILATMSKYDSGGHYGYNATITFSYSATVNINAYGLSWSGVLNSATLFGAGAITAKTYNNGDKAIVQFLVTCNDWT